MSFDLITTINQIFSSFSSFVISLLLSMVIFVNGFSDAPNAIATCVTTRATTPKKALIIFCIFNFLGILIMSSFSSRVVYTIFNLVNFNNSKSSIALIGALITIIIWSSFTGKRGIPTSESHALVSSLTGCVLALTLSINSVNINEWVKVFLGIIFSICLSFIISRLITNVIEFLFRNGDRRKTQKIFKRGQILSSASLSFMHGAQSGQKFIGVFILGLMLINNNLTTNFTIPIWLMIYSSFLITMGTLIGGYKTIKTIGMKMTKLELYQGTIVDLSTSICLFISSILGIPISTSHTKSLAITGVMSKRKKSKLNYNIIKRIILAGFITFPCCILLSFIITKLLLIVF